jgi:hypothetical protein
MLAVKPKLPNLLAPNLDKTQIADERKIFPSFAKKALAFQAKAIYARVF